MARRLREVQEDVAATAEEERVPARAEDNLNGRIDQLQAVADTAAGQVRNLYIAFLSFGLYLAITIGGTTHEQLLRSGPVRLPILNVELPLFAFFWIAPALFLLLHFNLLTQVCLLAEKLRMLDQAIEALDSEHRTQRRLRLHLFVFSHMLIGRHHRPLLRRLLTAMTWTTFVVLPAMVLLLAQIRFVPYHDLWSTWWHRGLVVLDLLVLWLLWTQAVMPEAQILRRLAHIRRRWHRLRAVLGNPLDWPAWPVIALLALLRAMVTLPAHVWRRLRYDPKRDWRLLRLQEISGTTLVIAFLVATIPGEFLAKPLDILIGPGQSAPLIVRNLVVEEANLVDAWPTSAQIEQFGENLAWQSFGKPISIRGRDLQYANFSRSIFLRADLQTADLRGANLPLADLRHANFRDARLQDAVIGKANLQGAVLVNADAKGADLYGADLRGAYLVHANLQGAFFRTLICRPLISLVPTFEARTCRPLI